MRDDTNVGESRSPNIKKYLSKCHDIIIHIRNTKQHNIDRPSLLVKELEKRKHEMTQKEYNDSMEKLMEQSRIPPSEIGEIVEIRREPGSHHQGISYGTTVSYPELETVSYPKLQGRKKGKQRKGKQKEEKQEEEESFTLVQIYRTHKKLGTDFEPLYIEKIPTKYLFSVGLKHIHHISIIKNLVYDKEGRDYVEKEDAFNFFANTDNEDERTINRAAYYTSLLYCETYERCLAVLEHPETYQQLFQPFGYKIKLEIEEGITKIYTNTLEYIVKTSIQCSERIDDSYIDILKPLRILLIKINTRLVEYFKNLYSDFSKNVTDMILTSSLQNIKKEKAAFIIYENWKKSKQRKIAKIYLQHWGQYATIMHKREQEYKQIFDASNAVRRQPSPLIFEEEKPPPPPSRDNHFTWRGMIETILKYYFHNCSVHFADDGKLFDTNSLLVYGSALYAPDILDQKYVPHDIDVKIPYNNNWGSLNTFDKTKESCLLTENQVNTLKNERRLLLSHFFNGNNLLVHLQFDISYIEGIHELKRLENEAERNTKYLSSEELKIGLSDTRKKLRRLNALDTRLGMMSGMQLTNLYIQWECTNYEDFKEKCRENINVPEKINIPQFIWNGIITKVHLDMSYVFDEHNFIFLRRTQLEIPYIYQAYKQILYSSFEDTNKVILHLWEDGRISLGIADITKTQKELKYLVQSTTLKFLDYILTNTNDIFDIDDLEQAYHLCYNYNKTSDLIDIIERLYKEEYRRMYEKRHSYMPLLAGDRMKVNMCVLPNTTYKEEDQYFTDCIIKRRLTTNDPTYEDDIFSIFIGSEIGGMVLNNIESKYLDY